MKPLTILITGDTGIGGTEKAATIYAAQLSARGHHVVFCGGEGPRASFLRNARVQLISPPSSVPEMLELIERINPDVVHQHVPGYWTLNHAYEALASLKSPRPKLIQTNVFGRLEDPRALGMVDFHFFVSQTSGSQAFRRAKLDLSNEWLCKCGVLMNPLLPECGPDPSFRTQFRQDHGISPSTLVALRIGQPGRGKWTDWEVKAVHEALRARADVKLVLMEPPGSLIPRLHASIDPSRLIILPATSDFSFINNLYSASDLMLHASYFGESFGYTIAEAMAAGLPVICRSTPWGDNAQVELVENGETGWTCATLTEMGRRVADYANHRELIQNMGQKGRRRIAELVDLQAEVDFLEDVIFSLLSGTMSQRIKDKNKRFADYHLQFPDREERFSEPNLPTRERLKWYSYRQYRKFRSALGNLRKKRNPLGMQTRSASSIG